MPPEQQKGQVGQYYLMEKIAQGGMAEIFKGLSYDVHGLKKTVCIKKILPQLSASTEFIDSLIDEAKLAVRLVHGNIAQTYDLGKVGDDYFMVMEFVDGKSLSQIHKRCQAAGNLIPISFLCSFASEILNGLNYMHRRTDDGGMPLHVVHRDISPQNIMVSYSGTVKIIDFGIAKAVFKVGSTDSGILKGKFAYMSPEQAHGDAIDHRSDIFSLGIILHEMLTGKRLFKAEDSRQTIRNVRRAKVDPPSFLRDDIPDELDRIVIKALAKDRRHRYAFASDMHADLVKFLCTTYPDFKPSDIAAFVQELFRDEVGRPQTLEADARTPHLIIDRSNSALADDSQFEATGAARAPTDMREYMLDEAPSSLVEEEEGEPEEVPDADMEEEHSGWAAKGADGAEEWTLPKARRPSLPIVRSLAIALGVAAVLLVGFFLVRHLGRGPEEPVRAFAEAIVVTDPMDASVSLDGRVVGQGSPVTIRNIPAGDEHVLSVTKDGYLPHERQITLQPGEFASLSVALTRAPASTASLEILSQPSGARVFIDDRETSHRTPAVITGLAIDREHTVGLYREGYRFWTKPVALKSGETKSFDVNLAKDFGSLFVDSSPPKALVMLGGIPMGQTPVTREDLEPDRVYKIDVWLEGYLPVSQEIKIVAGRREELRLILTPEPKVPEAAPRPSPPTPPAKGGEAKPPPTTTTPPPAPPAPKKPAGLIEEPAPIMTPR